MAEGSASTVTLVEFGIARETKSCVCCEGFPKGQTEMRRFTLTVGSTVSGWDPGVKVRGVSSFMDLGFLTVGAI